MAYYIDEHGTKIYIDSSMNDEELTKAINEGKLIAEQKRANDIAEKKMDSKSINIGDNNSNITINTGNMNINQTNENGNFCSKHPIWSAVIAGIITGVVLMFKFWEDIIGFIEGMFS